MRLGWCLVLSQQRYAVSLGRQCALVGCRGGGPGRWEYCWLASMPRTLMLVGVHGRVGGMATVETPCGMLTASAGGNPCPSGSRWRQPWTSFPCWRRRGGGAVTPQSPGENTRSPDRVAAAHLRRHLLEDATLEFSRCATLRCLGGGGLPRSALLGKASFVFCTRSVSRSDR